MNSVAALRLIAIPLMDMVTIMVCRIWKGHSPFKSERDHLYHICLHAGLSPLHALCFIYMSVALLATIGIILEVMDTPELVSLLLFTIFFTLHFFWGGVTLSGAC